MSRPKVLTCRLDPADYEAVMEAIILRKSALYRVNGEVSLPADTESDLAGACLAEICRDWSEELAGGVKEVPAAACTPVTFDEPFHPPVKEEVPA